MRKKSRTEQGRKDWSVCEKNEVIRGRSQAYALSFCPAVRSFDVEEKK
jgi:hypothetical protein